MSYLGTILQDLMSQATIIRGTSTRLRSGLRVSARILPPGEQQYSLTRTKTTPPSRLEAETVQKHARWANAEIQEGTTKGGLPCLLVTKVGP